MHCRHSIHSSTTRVIRIKMLTMVYNVRECMYTAESDHEGAVACPCNKHRVIEYLWAWGVGIITRQPNQNVHKNHERKKNRKQNIVQEQDIIHGS